MAARMIVIGGAPMFDARGAVDTSLCATDEIGKERRGVEER